MRNGVAGFTLVEMLAALMLIGLISVALFAGLRFGARVWDVGAERVAAANDAEASRSFLRRRLAQAQPLMMLDERGEPVPAFVGTPDTLRFAAPLPRHLGLGGHYLFDLRPGEDAGLLLDWQLLRMEGPVDVAGERLRPRLLFSGAQNIRFRYFGQRTGETEAAWQSEWSGEGHPPQMIELTFGEGTAPLRARIVAATGR